MDTVKILDKNKIVSLKYTHSLNYKEIDKKLLVDADTASWAFIHKDFFKLIDLINGKHTIGDILNYFSDKEVINEVLEMLWDSGILTLDNKTVVDKNPLQYEYAFEHAVLNVTLNCNLRCAYCYVDAGTSSSYMPPVIMEKIVREFVKFSRAERLSLLFHGGEPLLKFRNIKEGCKRIEKIKTDKKIKFLIQTNGTLITNPEE